MHGTRIPTFYRMTVPERGRTVRDRGLLSPDDYRILKSGKHTLSVQLADKMIENVIGVMGLPVGLGLNFLINDREYVVPLVVEEPSIVAALSSAAKLARECGGFQVESMEPQLIGQVQIVDVTNPSRARAALLQRKDEILNLANSLHPKMIARGGGARDLEVYIHPSQGPGGDMVVVHLLVDTRDAMGANLVNTMCEGVASLIENIADGLVFLRILANLADRALVRAKVRIPVEKLTGKGFDGEQVRDGIIVANDFARIDPYRAATHNKGIMNGIDPLAIATGNDWRAIEAAAHAYAGQGGHYSSLTNWFKKDSGALVGTIEIPLKVGIVGGSLKSNKSVGLAHRILGIESATELAEVMGAVGLAQNLSALRSLGTEGIQRGHMTLHARSVASTAGAPPELFDKVLERLLDSGKIKVWKAKEIINELQTGRHEYSAIEQASALEGSMSYGYGKIIITGEHSVVYGMHAVAAPISLGMKAKVRDHDSEIRLIIPRWGVERTLKFGAEHPHSIYRSLEIILDQLGLREQGMVIEVAPEIPKAMGMGGSAALAVAIIRALDTNFKLGLSDEDVRELSFKSENIIHGRASGIDNTVATYGRLILFQKDNPPLATTLNLAGDIPIVIGISGVESMTSKMILRIRKAREKHPEWYDDIFARMNELSLASGEAIESGDLARLGHLMNLNHGYLNTLSVSCPQVEELIDIARNNGAFGAKVTGGGGGGAMIALCDSEDVQKNIREKMYDAGYDALATDIKASAD